MFFILFLLLSPPRLPFGHHRRPATASTLTRCLMSTSYRSFLRNLPVKSPLVRSFLAARGFEPDETMNWEAEEPQVFKQLAAGIAQYEDGTVRDHVIGDLGHIAQLADAAGTLQIINVSLDRPAIAAGFADLETPEQRALWLHEAHPDKFSEALEVRFFDERAGRSTCHDLKIQGEVDRSESARQDLASRVAAFYRQKLGAGQACEVEVIDRYQEQSVQVTIYVQDLSNHRIEFDAGQLHRRRSFPAIEVALIYHPTTGYAETVGKGGQAYHQQWVADFAAAMLHQEVSPDRILPQPYKLNNLLYGVAIHEAARLGIECVFLKSLTLLNLSTGFEMTFKSTGRQQRHCVLDQIAQQFPQENPLHRLLLVTQATITVHFYPLAGHRRGRVVSLELNCKGKSNLGRLEEKYRQLFKKLLPLWGVTELVLDRQSPSPEGGPDLDYSEAA
jgi:hypothetical protein